MKHFPPSVLLYALVLALATSLPYLVGWLSAPSGWSYSGAPAVPVGVAVDYNSHLAKMWQGSRGHLDYRLLFTHEAHPALPLVQSFYVWLGLLGAILPISLPLLYHLARFVLTYLMVLALWRFACRFFSRSDERWLALTFATLVGGWSWLLLVIDPAMTTSLSPIEFWLTDAFNLLGALYMPHFAAAIALQIVAFLSFDDWVRGQGRWRLPVLTLSLGALSLIQPYVILLSGALLVILTAYHVFSARRLTLARASLLLIPLGLHASLVVYQYLAINADPVWASFADQNKTLSPLVSYYLFAYLTFLIPIVLGLSRFLTDVADDRWWLPILWVALVAMLLYAPFPTQRRYLLGVQTPLAVLAAYGFSRAVWPRLRRRAALVTVIYVTLASVSLVGMLLANVGALTSPQRAPAAFYSPEELAAFATLRQQASPDDLVLTTFDQDGQGSGGRLVGAIGQRVFIGHWYETAEFERKIDELRRFYDPDTSDTWRMTFLKDIEARFIWYDADAHRLGNWDPAGASFLVPVYRSENLAVYRVVLS